MKTHNILGLLIGVGLAGSVQGERIPWDDLLKEVDTAGRNLANGTERSEVLRCLRGAIVRNPKSHYLALAQRLSRDLSDSVHEASFRAALGLTLDNSPETFLAETRMPSYLVAVPDPWTAQFKKFMEQYARDPTTLILAKDRKFIERLLPLLQNDSPTRSHHHFRQGVPQVPRVCDVALHLIEFFSQCKFHFNATSGRPFHELSPKDRDKVIERINEWWRENKDRTLVAGIRSQLPHGDFHAKLAMAKNLARPGDGKNAEDREYALEVLRDLVRQNRGHYAVYAADALAECGDHSTVERFYAECKAVLDGSSKKTIDSSLVFYLTNHGKRREWELLVELAKRELRGGLELGTARVWPALVNCQKAGTSPYAIPGLALALSQTKATGARWIDEGQQQFSTADVAAEFLQTQTGVNFGYKPGGTVKERTEAIRRAQKWWAEEGEAKYTFDYIEKHLVGKDSGKKRE